MASLTKFSTVSTTGTAESKGLKKVFHGVHNWPCRTRRISMEPELTVRIGPTRFQSVWINKHWVSKARSQNISQTKHSRDTIEFDCEKSSKDKANQETPLVMTVRNDKKQGIPRDIECMTFQHAIRGKTYPSCNTFCCPRGLNSRPLIILRFNAFLHQNSNFDLRKIKRHGSRSNRCSLQRDAIAHRVLQKVAPGQKLSKFDAQAHRLANHWDALWDAIHRRHGLGISNTQKQHLRSSPDQTRVSSSSRIKHRHWPLVGSCGMSPAMMFSSQFNTLMFMTRCWGPVLRSFLAFATPIRPPSTFRQLSHRIGWVHKCYDSPKPLQAFANLQMRPRSQGLWGEHLPWGLLSAQD